MMNHLFNMFPSPKSIYRYTQDGKETPELKKLLRQFHKGYDTFENGKFYKE